MKTIKITSNTIREFSFITYLCLEDCATSIIDLVDMHLLKKIEFGLLDHNVEIILPKQSINVIVGNKKYILDYATNGKLFIMI